MWTWPLLRFLYPVGEASCARQPECAQDRQTKCLHGTRAVPSRERAISTRIHLCMTRLQCATSTPPRHPAFSAGKFPYEYVPRIPTKRSSSPPPPPPPPSMADSGLWLGHGVRSCSLEEAMVPSGRKKKQIPPLGLAEGLSLPCTFGGLRQALASRGFCLVSARLRECPEDLAASGTGRPRTSCRSPWQDTKLNFNRVNRGLRGPDRPHVSRDVGIQCSLLVDLEVRLPVGLGRQKVNRIPTPQFT